MENLFKELGFTANESKVYLTTAEVGKAGASLLAKRLALPRSTVYSVLDSLVSKGVIKLEQTGSTAYYVANSPDSLKRMLEREAEDLKERIRIKEESLAQLMPQINSYFKNENYSIPKLQFFEGQANVENMLYEMQSVWQESISKYDITWWWYQDHHFVETYREWLDQYWQSKLPGESIKLLSNRSNIEKALVGKVTRREIKLVPKNLEFSSTIWVLGDYVITIVSRQKPHYAYMLKDSVTAANQRAMFQYFWSLA